MTFHYSRPYESLLVAATNATARVARTRVVIVGSGYGGSVAAFRLANPSFKPEDPAHFDVLVLERGKEYRLGEFPTTLADIPKHIRVPGGTDESSSIHDALFDLRVGDNVDVLIGSGLGGTSLINANVAIRPDLAVFKRSPWPSSLDTTSLANAFDNVSEWLDVASDPPVRAYAKFKSFQHTAAHLGCTANPAPLSVMFEPTTNRAGVNQPACTGCGNCVSGCNVGAKNTLAMNLIPAAHAKGATFLTGAWVSSIQPYESRWRVHVQPTSRLTRARHARPHFIEADVVILCAGALGSTEILQRSQALHFIRCSPKLGQQFSTNGDAIAASFGEGTRVDAIGDEAYSQPVRPAGPTITACAHVDSDPERPRYLLQDGAIPSAIVDVVGEVITTAAQLGRIGHNALPKWFEQSQMDALACHRGALEHSQVFLIMSNDANSGALTLDGLPTPDRPHIGSLTPRWPLTRNERLHGISRELAQLDRTHGLHGGQFVQNPLWQALSEDAMEVMSGKLPSGRLLTVHPLGGCGMGENVSEGVVNHRGQVFDANNGAVFEGLYVMDGSIIPCSLGVNPFLTIAALAWRACDALAGTEHERPALQPLLRNESAKVEARPGHIIVREQLIGSLEHLHAATRSSVVERWPASRAWLDRNPLILRLETLAEDTSRALGHAAPGAPIRVRVTLFEGGVSTDQMRRWKTTRVATVAKRTLVAHGTGTLTVLAPDPPTDDGLERRRLALEAYRRRRGSSFWLRLLALLSRYGAVPERLVNAKSRFRRLRHLHKFLEAADMQTTYRTFEYRLLLRSAQGDVPIQIEGIKKMAWRQDHAPLWAAFTRLPLRIAIDGIDCGTTRFDVDLNDLICEGLITAAPGADATRALMSSISYLMRLARGALQVGFWEFGAPDYPCTAIGSAYALPMRLARHKLLTTRVRVPRSLACRAPTQLQLHRYGRSGSRKVVVLVHGLAQSSLIYAHPALRLSMAEYFLGQGYNVWLIDYRISARVPGVADVNESIDEIADIDVPNAIKRIAEAEEGRPLHVFAHCVGAVALSMAILKGHLRELPIASVVLNAIHPWVLPSAFNEARARVGTLFRDYVSEDCLIPVPQARSQIKPAQALLDRLAFSVAQLVEQGTGGHAEDMSSIAAAICDRMTLLYGRMWRHENVKHIHRHWLDLVGPAPTSIYRHLHMLLLNERLVNADGDPTAYLNKPMLAHWRGFRTLFLHGEESEVFNPQSATRSAIQLSRVTDSVIRLMRIAGYGHMDPILADDANDRCFGHLHAFFSGHFDQTNEARDDGGSIIRLDAFNESDDPLSHMDDAISCGPTIRGVGVRDGRVYIRYWLERSLLRPATSLAEYIPGMPVAITDVTPPNVEAGCHWIDAAYDEHTFSAPWFAAAGLNDQTSFIVGSCYYPGMPFDQTHADQAFAGMSDVLDTELACEAVFLIGDFIYADATAGLFDPRPWRDRYVHRYRVAMNAPHARRLLSRLPVYFAVDDHEIANDYAGLRKVCSANVVNASYDLGRKRLIRSGEVDCEQLDVAVRAARSFVGSARSVAPLGSATIRSDELWYPLNGSELSCPAFILDTRTERTRATNNKPAQLIDGPQQHAFFAWLEAHQSCRRPKFVFMSSPLAPLLRDTHVDGVHLRDDGLIAYREQVDEWLAFIVRKNIRGLVFVSGDLHLSCTAELTFKELSTGRSIKALQIVSSALYAPLAFVNTSRDDIDWDVGRRISLSSILMRYRAQFLSAHRSQFARVTAAKNEEDWTVTVCVYDEKGGMLAQVSHPIET